MQPRDLLVRVVRAPDGTIAVDPGGNADGRGCYVCRNAQCIQRGIKIRFVNRAFRCEVPSEVYTEVQRYASDI